MTEILDTLAANLYDALVSRQIEMGVDSPYYRRGKLVNRGGSEGIEYDRVGYEDLPMKDKDKFFEKAQAVLGELMG